MAPNTRCPCPCPCPRVSKLAIDDEMDSVGYRFGVCGWVMGDPLLLGFCEVIAGVVGLMPGEACAEGATDCGVHAPEAEAVPCSACTAFGSSGFVPLLRLLTKSFTA